MTFWQLRCSGCALAVLFSGFSISAWAWEFTPELAVSELYSDNIALAPSGLEESDRVTRVAPALTVRGAGPNSELNMDYRYERLAYAQHSENNTNFQQLGLKANQKLFEKHLALDVNGSYTQQAISPDQAAAPSNSFVTANRTNIASVDASPSLHWRLGNSAEAAVRTGYGVVKYRDAPEFDSNIRHTSAEMHDTNDANNLGWRLAYQHQSIFFETASDVELQRAGLELNYRMIHRLRLLFEAGREQNTYPHSQNAVDTSGNYREIGVAWQPSSRTSVELRRGDRFLGSTWSFKAKHKLRHTQMRLEYREDVETAAQRQLEQVTLGSSTGAMTAAALSTDTFFSKRFEGEISHQRGRTNFAINLYRDLREYQTDLTTDTRAGVHLTLEHSLTPVLAVRLQSNAEKYETSTSSQQSRFNDLEMGVDRKIGRNGDLQVAYGVYQRRADQHATEYSSHMISAQLRKRF